MTEPTESSEPALSPEAAKEAALDRLAKLKPWVALTPRAPWKLYGRGTIPCAVRRLGDRVELRGAVIGGGRGEPVLDLPETCRPPGLTKRPIAVALNLDVRTVGIALATITADGLVVIETDSWQTARFFDLGAISFSVDDVLAEQIKLEATRARPKATRTENLGGIVVAVPS